MYYKKYGSFLRVERGVERGGTKPSNLLGAKGPIVGALSTIGREVHLAGKGYRVRLVRTQHNLDTGNDGVVDGAEGG